jgi:hypothetical protein
MAGRPSALPYLAGRSSLSLLAGAGKELWPIEGEAHAMPRSSNPPW